MVGPVRCAVFDDGIRDPGDFCGDCGARFALAVGIFRALLDIAFVLCAEGIFAKADGAVCSHPEGIPESGVTALGESCMAALLS